MSKENHPPLGLTPEAIPDEYLVTTFPIGARGAVPKLGLLTTSLVADVLARRHDNVTSQIAFNVLDSYQNRSDRLGPLLAAHETLGINTSNAWIDADPANRADLNQTIGILAAQGAVREEQADVIVCDPACQRVEMLADAKTHPKGRLYHKIGEKLLCNSCDTIALPQERTVLTMQFPETLPAPVTYPGSMQSDVDELSRRTSGMRTLVSRSRETGIVFEGDTQSHNLDVDFYWMNYLRSIAQDKKGVAVVGSNHVRRHLTTITGLYDTVMASQPDAPEVKLIMPSYITPTEGIEDFVNGGYLKEADPNTVRLLLLSSVSWLRDAKWASNSYKYLQNRLRAVDWKNDSRTSLQNLAELHEDCEKIRGANLTKALQRPSDQTKHDIRGVIV